MEGLPPMGRCMKEPQAVSPVAGTQDAVMMETHRG
jgi:hypothetical protein